MTKRDRKNRQNRRSKWKSYGINPGVAELLYDTVKECQVCGATKKLCIDHCHDTNKIRGVLCKHCNVALGHIRDDPETAERLATYLRQRAEDDR